MERCSPRGAPQKPDGDEPVRSPKNTSGDKRLNRLISYIHHTCEYKQYCHVGNTAKQCRLGLFQDCDFVGILRIQNPLLEEHCAFSEVTFVPISWMCKKQTAVSHSSTESEIISLDAGLRLDGILALDSWDLIVSVFGRVTQTTERTGRPVIIDRSQRSQGKINALNNIDCVPSNVQSSHGPTELRLIGCSIELTWTQKSKSSASTPKTNSLIF